MKSSVTFIVIMGFLMFGSNPTFSDDINVNQTFSSDTKYNLPIRSRPKSIEILEAVDNRYDPMPEYMMAQIMEGKKYLGAKEVLEAKIQSWSQIRSKAKADLMREFLLDTNMISPLDSVIAFLENETDMDSRYNLALAQWNNSNQVGAWETLNTIPTQFTFNESQIVDHENYLAYFSVLQTLADSNWRACQLDSASVSVLFDLKETGNPRLAALARGLLVKGGFFKYIETINYPDLTKSSPITIPLSPFSCKETIKDKLWLFPNPAGDYVIACYDLEQQYEAGEIHLVDAKGNKLKKYSIHNGKDQVIIDLKDYPIGIYIITLTSDHYLLDNKKLSKGRK